MVVTVAQSGVDTYEGRWLKGIGHLRGLRSLIIRAGVRNESLAATAPPPPPAG